MSAIWLRLSACALVSMLLSGCGIGVAGAIAASEDSSGSAGNSEPSIRSFTTAATKLSPLELSFTLVDPESDPLDVTLELEHPTGAQRRALTLVGDTDLAGLAASPTTGTTHVRSWDFASDLGTNARVEDVHLILTIVGGRGTVRAGASFLELSVAPGNDRPSILPVANQLPAPPAEIGGPVPLNFKVSDSSSESVALRVQYNDVPGFPDAGWKNARPAGLAPGAPTPDEAIPGITALAEGTDLTFAWDSSFDLGGRDVLASLRLQARESAAPNALSEFATIGPVKVDNNLPPEVELDVSALIFDPDRRRVVPLTLRVDDGEQDDVQVAVQWRHEDEDFPDLPATAEDLRHVLGDPALRRALHVASEEPRPYRGRLIPVDGGADRARLPELSTTEWLLLSSCPEGTRESLRGKRLEVLGSTVPARVSDRWPASVALTGPTAVLPRGDGSAVLVLESLPDGTWRLRELERTSGSPGSLPVISGPGQASAMTYDEPDASVLLAVTENGDWSLERVDLRAGSVALLYEDLGRRQRGAIRDLARLGSHEALITVGHAVIRVSYPDGAPSRAALVGGAGWISPHGIAVDPADPRRVFVSEPLQDRITLFDLETFVRSPLAVSGLDVPRDLEVDRATNELVVLSGGTRLERIAIARAEDANGDGIGERHLSVVARNLPQTSLGLSCGPDGFTGFADTAGCVFAGGGVEQGREIADYDAATQTVRVDPPFQPPVTTGNTWRILESFSLAGRDQDVFSWDSAETGTGGTLFLRVVGIDEDIGVASDEVPKELRSELDGAFQDLPISGNPALVSFVDFDADGDLDLLSSDPSGVDLLRQTTAGSFESVADILPGRELDVAADVDQDGLTDLLSGSEVFRQSSPGAFRLPVTFGTGRAVAVGDLTGDGLADIVSSDSTSRVTSVWRQVTGFAFAQGASFSETSLSTTRLADLDGDGRLDIVGAEFLSIPVFLQEAPGQFNRRDLLTEGFSSCFPSHDDYRVADLDANGQLDIVISTDPRLCNDEIVGSDFRFYFDVGRHPPGAEVLPDRIFGGNLTTPENSLVVTIGDVDEDGSDDLVAGRNFVSKGSTGVYDTVSPILAGQDSGLALANLDLNGDGRRDLVSSGLSPGSARLFLRDEFGATGTPCDGPVGFQVATYMHAATFDFDGDRLLDVVATSGIDEVHIFLQQHPGRFDTLPRRFFIPNFFATDLLVGDLDSDGSGDLLLVNAGPVSCSTPTLGGGFLCRNTRASATLGCLDLSGPTNMELADMDGDGRLELVVLHFLSSGRGVAIFELTGAPPLEIPSDGSYSLGDLDLDGDLDIVQVAATTGEVLLHEQMTPEVFSSSTLLPGLADFALAVVDMDRDGVPDVVLARDGGTDVWFGSESRGFERVVIGGTGSVRDVNRDGALDLLLSSGAQLQIQPRRFALETVQVPLRGPDLDGDGDADRIQVPGTSLFFCYGGR